MVAIDEKVNRSMSGRFLPFITGRKLRIRWQGFPVVGGSWCGDGRGGDSEVPSASGSLFAASLPCGWRGLGTCVIRPVGEAAFHGPGMTRVG